MASSLQTILSRLAREIELHENRTETPSPSVTDGSVAAAEVTGLIQNAMFRGGFRDALELAKGLTSYDVESFLARYPEHFADAWDD